MEKRAYLASPRTVRAARTAPRPVKRRIKTAIAWAVLLLFAVMTTGTVYLLSIFVQVSRTLPSVTEIGNYTPREHTVIYYADGPPMAILKSENVRPVKIEDVSQHVIDATIAIEDSRFYEHKGVDYHGIARAMYKNVFGGDLSREGASTITQQLARNLNELGLSKEKKLRRKVAEAILAVRIEQAFEKDEILEMYLNTIYYGNGAYGVEAASQTYFHKSNKKLSVAEAAYLAGLPQRPSLFGENRDAALDRQKQVLNRMVATGKLNDPDAVKARNSKFKVYKAKPVATEVFGAPYVVNHVIGKLEAAYGHEAVYSGLKIYTTIDSRIQKAAEKALKEGIREHRWANQGALVSIDPRTGFIRAMVGGVDIKQDEFNAITQGKRQPGSSFKPFVYAALIDSGKGDLNTSFMDSPDFEGASKTNKWRPKNYNGKYSYGSVSVLSAIKHSLNTIAVKAAMSAGLNNVIDYAHRMGITTDIAPYPPLALGSSAVRPLDLCSAYSVFANGGKRVVPATIQKVIDAEGNVIEEATQKVDDPHLRPETVQMIDKALREVVLHGTGTAAAGVPEARGKTGTTSDNIDAWFAGYTPELATVIWVAHVRRDAKKRVHYDEMPGATGGTVCAPMWTKFMMEAVPIQQAYNSAGTLPDPKKAAATVPVTTKRNGDMKPLGPANTEKKITPDPVATEDTHTSPDGPIQSPGALSEPGVPANGTTPATSTPSGTAIAPVETKVNRGATSTGASAGDARLIEPGGRVAPPPVRREDSPDDVISVRLCAETMQKATKWCPVTVDRRVRRKDAAGPCRAHRSAPDTDGN